MKLTTTNLQLIGPRARWYDIPVPIAATICILALLMIVALVGQLRSASTAAAVPTPALPVLMIQTATPQVAHPTPAPVVQVAAIEPTHYVVAFAAPDGAVLGAIPAPDTSAIEARYGDAWYMVTWNGAPAWVRASELGLQIADLAPERVVVVNAPAAPQAPAYAPPTLEPPVYQTDQQQGAGDFYTTPPVVQPEFQDALVGDDPNALACGGSPMCGGLTNAQAQEALDRQRNIQNRMVNDRVGGSGKNKAPELGTMDSAAQWCASASNGAKCVEP